MGDGAGGKGKRRQAKFRNAQMQFHIQEMWDPQATELTTSQQKPCILIQVLDNMFLWPNFPSVFPQNHKE